MKIYKGKYLEAEITIEKWGVNNYTLLQRDGYGNPTSALHHMTYRSAVEAKRVWVKHIKDNIKLGVA